MAGIPKASKPPVNNAPRRLPSPSPDLIEKAKRALPPPRFPRGFFDPMVPLTRTLLDQGLRLSQAADWLIDHGQIEATHRRPFASAMRGRISRLKREKIVAGQYFWKASLFYDSTHLVSGDDRKAICGATATLWTDEISESNRCARCIGLGRKNGLVTI